MWFQSGQCLVSILLSVSLHTRSECTDGLLTSVSCSICIIVWFLFNKFFFVSQNVLSLQRFSCVCQVIGYFWVETESCSPHLYHFAFKEMIDIHAYSGCIVVDIHACGECVVSSASSDLLQTTHPGAVSKLQNLCSIFPSLEYWSVPLHFPMRLAPFDVRSFRTRLVPFSSHSWVPLQYHRLVIIFP